MLRFNECQFPPAREGSWEEILHRVHKGNQMLIFDQPHQSERWRETRGHRAIGVVYHSQSERHGNYVPTVLPERYDAFLFLDKTEALHVPPNFEHEEVSEIFPSGV